MRRTLLVILGIILTTGTGLIQPENIYAYDKQFFSSNDILFYNPDDHTTSPTCTSSTAVSQSTSVSLSKNQTLQSIFQALINGGMNAVQAAAVMGNMYHESDFNPDQHEVGNDIGYGLAQWSFDRRTNLENYAKSKSTPVADMNLQLSFLLQEYKNTYKTQLAGTAFASGTDVAAATRDWMNIYETPALKPANDPAGLNSARIPAAIKIYGFYNSLSPTATVASLGCSPSGNSVVAGNMVQTAINLALQTPATDGMTAKTDARNTYQVAKEQYNPPGPNGVPSWSDCGGFIATVMISSGVDTNYPKVGVDAQLAYVEAHPEKYKVIQKWTVSDLQPGDILLSTQAGHTTMYTGASPYPDVDASLDQRVPSVRTSGSHLWMLAHGAVIARVIK